jgi:hypothetical protein
MSSTWDGFPSDSGTTELPTTSLAPITFVPLQLFSIQPTISMDEDMTDAMITDIVNHAVDEAVKVVITKSAMEIISEVVRDMLKTDSSVSALKDTVRNDVFDAINTKIEALVDKRINKTVEQALIKVGLQAELEMVSFVLHLYELLTTDLHPGQADL